MCICACRCLLVCACALLFSRAQGTELNVKRANAQLLDSAPACDSGQTLNGAAPISQTSSNSSAAVSTQQHHPNQFEKEAAATGAAIFNMHESLYLDEHDAVEQRSGGAGAGHHLCTEAALFLLDASVKRAQVRHICEKKHVYKETCRYEKRH